jgi:HD-like signal output (HDOD) protein
MNLSAKGQATIALLKQRMREAGDFPSLAESVQDIIVLANDLDSRQNELVEQVLGDYALTKKVLTLANSAMYSPFGGPVTRISQALRVLGTDALSHLAMGLRLLDAFESATASAAAESHFELVRAALAGGIARRIAAECSMPGVEEAAVYTLLYQTGRILCSVYLPDDWQEIQDTTGDDRESENRRARARLGLSLDELGQAMGEQWKLPKELVSFVGDERNTAIARMRQLAAASSGLSEALVRNQPDRLALRANKLGPALGLKPEALSELATAAFVGNERLARAAKVIHAAQEPAAQVLARARAALGLAADGNRCAVRQVADALHRAFRMDGLVVFQEAGGSLEPILCLGDEKAFLSRTRVRRDGRASLFFGSLDRNAPVLVHNAADPLILKNVPDWARSRSRPAAAFLLVPVRGDNGGALLIYGEWASQPRDDILSQEERNLVLALRDSLARQLPALPQKEQICA